MADAKKSKIFTGSLYPDAENYDCMKVLETIKAKFKQWAFAAHDSDVNDDGGPKKLHIHWVGRGDPRTVSAVAKFLGIPEHDIEIGRNFKSLVQYLIHKNDPDKFQYDPEIIESNIPDIGMMFRDLSEGQIVKDLSSAKLERSWYDLIQYAVDNDFYDVLRRNWGLIKLVQDEYEKYHPVPDSVAPFEGRMVRKDI